jgi:hypothetical protein
MKILVTIGYQDVLLDGPIGDTIRLLGNARMVERKGYGSDALYIEGEKATARFELVSDEQCVTKDSPKSIEHTEKELADLRIAYGKSLTDKQALEQKVKCLELAKDGA